MNETLPRPQESKKSLSYIILSFVIDLGPAGITRILKNGISYDSLYKEFCEEHPGIKISLEEFENLVVESLKRVGAATAAEIAAIPGSMAGSAIAKLSQIQPQNTGLCAFTGSILLNFVAFAGVWATSHSHKFTKNGRFEIKNFTKSLVSEYGAHFGPIAVGADFLEAYMIQILANSNLDPVLSSAIVTSVGSSLAVILYFYEQQLRSSLKTGKIADSIKSRIYTTLTPVSYKIGSAF
jgi:hypothetical protein